MAEVSAVVMADDIVLSLPWNDIQMQFYGYFSISFSCIDVLYLLVKNQDFVSVFMAGYISVFSLSVIPHC